VASDPQLIEQAGRQREQVLGAFFKAIGWKVIVRWGES
jgi:hypothetical protein